MAKQTIEKSDKSHDGKILNPATGRWVNATGKIGLQIKMQMNEKTKTNSQKIKTNTKVNSPKIKSKTKSTHETTRIKIENYDQLVKQLTKLANIKLSTEKFVPFLTMLDVPINGYQKDANDEFIQGYYNKAHFVFQKHEKHEKHTNSIDLSMRVGDVHILLKDIFEQIQLNRFKCTIYCTLENKNNDSIIETCTDLCKYALDDLYIPKNIEKQVYEFMYPASYKEDDTKQVYVTAKPPPTVSVADNESGQYDPCYVSNVDNNIVYVFHVYKPDGRSMKGYDPVGVSVVHRFQKKVNYKYTTMLRLTYSAWGAYKGDMQKVSEYIREMRNIIKCVPYLAKFRGLSPYPRILIDCKVSQYRHLLRTCM